MNYDTVIVGAGVIGTSTAYHLLKNSPKQKILLIDQNNKIAQGNTSRSAALYRNLFSSAISRKLSTSSITFYETIAERIALKDLGYFWMFSKEDWQKSKKGFEKLDKKRDKFEILTPEQIPENLQLHTKSSDEFNGVYRILHGFRCGSLSAVNLAKYYAKKFQELGGKIILNTHIKKIVLSEKDRFYPPWAKVRITTLIDVKEVKFKANNFIFTTGAWTNKLLSPIGIASQIYPQKRQMFTLKLQDSSQIVKNLKEKVPILILPTGGVYIKPVLQNNILVVGCANELGNPFEMDDYPPEAEQGYFSNAIEPVIQYYFPNLKDYKLFSQWAGYYAYYWPDKNPVIEKVSNIQWVSGTSGSGIMKADAIGRIAAARNLGLKKIELFDKTTFTVNDLSLKKRKVDAEELII